MNVYQAVTIASIVQAEAATKEDMGKVARVIFNRLERACRSRWTPPSTTR